MKTNRLFIASRERHAGSLLISLGIMSLLRQQFERIAFFRPIVEDKNDADFTFINDSFDLNLSAEQMIGMTLSEATRLLSHNKRHELLETLVEKIEILSREYDFILIEGLELTRQANALDVDLNASLAKHFNAPFVSVLNARQKSMQDIQQALELEIHACRDVDPFAFFVNRVDPDQMPTSDITSHLPVFFIPELGALNLPTVDEIVDALNGTRLTQEDAGWNRLVKEPIVAAMTPEHYLPRVQENDLVIVPGDRTDILLASALSIIHRKLPNIAAIVLTGDLRPSPAIQELVFHFADTSLPIFSVTSDTYDTAMQAANVRAQFSARNLQKTNMALGLFDQSVQRQTLMNKFFEQSHLRDVMTPIMFELSLFERARQHLTTIVLPEADDERILKACEILHNRRVVKPLLLGNADDIEYRASLLGIQLDGVVIIDPKTSDWKEAFAQDFYHRRKSKGMTLDAAQDAMAHPTYFATMMVEKGYADGMVSGATHTTAETIRPALQIIKTPPDISRVSSVFFMCFDTRVLVYGDCAVNQNPDAEQLAEIALSSADTATQFGIEPRVAFLSYSTGESGKGSEVDKVRKATEIAKQKRPDLRLEGPIQYDAAIDPTVAKQKMPDSLVAGKATVFVFPDLNTGNNTYKAVQRSSGAVAIGPILQGLNKPVNDLSRGCSIADIVNTVAITAIQAQPLS